MQIITCNASAYEAPAVQLCKIASNGEIFAAAAYQQLRYFKHSLVKSNRDAVCQVRYHLNLAHSIFTTVRVCNVHVVKAVIAAVVHGRANCGMTQAVNSQRGSAPGVLFSLDVVQDEPCDLLERILAYSAIQGQGTTYLQTSQELISGGANRKNMLCSSHVQCHFHISSWDIAWLIRAGHQSILNLSPTLWTSKLNYLL